MTLPAEINWIDSQHAPMCRRVTEWSNRNSATGNLSGLAAMAAVLGDEFSVLGGTAQEMELPPGSAIDALGNIIPIAVGKAISFTKRPGAPLQVFLGIHMDTVYPADGPFQSTMQMDANTLRGPGVTDAKGGLAVMLTALEAFERSRFADHLGWEILINPDEEIGSIGSAPLLALAAHRNHLGLLFEPALPNGDLVDQRKGSGNFTAIIRGRSAHAGRDFSSGRNAIVAMADLAIQLHALNAALPNITLNVAKIEGGGPANVVPDLAICRFNIRISTPQDETLVLDQVSRLITTINSRDGLGAELHGGFTSPPKLLDDRTRALLHQVIACGQDLGLSLASRPSGGACDGNKLAAAGLPNIDSLGVRGGNIHSPEEFILLDSLTERAKLTALLLIKLATGTPPGIIESSRL